jgi:hypothetical protein
MADESLLLKTHVLSLRAQHGDKIVVSANGALLIVLDVECVFRRSSLSDVILNYFKIFIFQKFKYSKSAPDALTMDTEQKDRSSLHSLVPSSAFGYPSSSNNSNTTHERSSTEDTRQRRWKDLLADPNPLPALADGCVVVFGVAIACVKDPRFREERHKICVDGFYNGSDRQLPWNRRSLQRIVDFIDNDVVDRVKDDGDDSHEDVVVITELWLHCTELWYPADGGVQVLRSFFCKKRHDTYESHAGKILFW